VQKKQEELVTMQGRGAILSNVFQVFYFIFLFLFKEKQ